MIHIRKAARLAVLISTSIALAFYASDHPNGTVAQWLLIIGAISISSAWASVWPAPHDEWPEHRIY